MTKTHPQTFFSHIPEKLQELFSVEHVWEVMENFEKWWKDFSFEKQEIAFSGVTFEDSQHIYIGKNVKIEAGVHIKGPCFIGDNCEIRQGAYIRGHVFLDDHCVVGHCSEVKASILLSGAAIPHFNYIGNSILGHKVNLGAGVICANYPLHGKPLSIRIKDKVYPSNLKKLGAIIGDHVQIGCNSVMNPATFIGKNCIGYPLIRLHGWIEEGKRMKQSTV